MKRPNDGQSTPPDRPAQPAHSPPPSPPTLVQRIAPLVQILENAIAHLQVLQDHQAELAQSGQLPLVTTLSL